MRDTWLGLRHVALRVTDVERAEAFYTGLFGMSVEWKPDPDNVYLTSGQDNVALHRVDSSSAAGEGALDHIGFMVTTPDAVDTWRERAAAHGAEIVQDVKTHRDGARSFYLRDSEGNTIQIIHHPPLERLPAGPDPRG